MRCMFKFVILFTLKKKKFLMLQITVTTFVLFSWFLNFVFVDISELNLPKSCNISFPKGKDELMSFEVTIRPDEGYYL